MDFHRPNFARNRINDERLENPGHFLAFRRRYDRPWDRLVNDSSGIESESNEPLACPFFDFLKQYIVDEAKAVKVVEEVSGRGYCLT
ncbi:MAG: hypothetical protein V7609_3163 [Verrucomicrobiota bacterium]